VIKDSNTSTSSGTGCIQLAATGIKVLVVSSVLAYWEQAWLVVSKGART